MTKSSKRGLLTFLTVVALAMCAFASYGISAAANAAEETKAEKFTRIVSYFKDETIDDDLLVSEHALEFAGIEGGNAVFLYQSTEAEGGLSAEEKAGLDPEIKALYDEVYAIFEKPYAAKAKIADLYTLANTAVKDVMYADKAKVEEARALYDDLTENGRTFVKNALVNKDENLTGAESVFAAKKALIDAAVTAIGEIEYYDASSKTMTTGDGEIVLGSKDSIDAAKQALDEIYGRDIYSEELKSELVYITNFADYESAATDYAAWTEKAAAVEAQIGAVQVEEGKVYYTKKGEIAAAKDSFDKLLSEDKRTDADGSENFNDLQSLISAEAKEKLEGMLAEIAGIEKSIAALRDAIAQIPAEEELKYTAEHNGLIETAEGLFAALDEDIRNNDESVYAGGEGEYIVESYAAMADARKIWNAWDKQVKDLVVSLEELIANAEIENFDLKDAFGKIQSTLNAFTPEQKTTFEGTKISFKGNENDTCQNVMAFFQAEINKITAAVAPVINAIDKIPADVTVSEEYYNALQKANELYDALPEDYKQYVTNYDKLAAANEAYGELTATVKVWQDKLNEFELGDIHTDNMALVDEAVALYGEISEEAREVIEGAVSGDYFDSYAKYTAAIGEKAALLENIGKIAAAMNALDPEQPAMEDIEEYDEAYQSVKSDFEALDEADRKWLAAQEEYFVDAEKTVTYKAAYEKYLLVIDNAVAVHVEVLIAAIGSPVTLESKADIDGARAEYEALSAPQKEKVRNIEALAKAEEELAAITEKLDRWMEEVSALRGGASLEELWSVDLNAAEELEKTYAEFDAAEQAYVADGRAELDAIKAKSDERIADLNGRIAEIPDTLTSEDQAALEAIKADYGKLHETQKEKVDYDVFMNSYNKVNFATYFDRAVNAIKAEVDKGHFVLEDKIFVAVLKNILTSASEELRGLVTTADLLDELELAYEGKELLDLTSSVEELKSQIEELEGKLNDRAAELQGAIDELRDSLETAVGELDGKIESEIAKLDEALKAYIAAEDAKVKAELEKAMDDLQSLLENALKENGEADAAAKAALEKQISDLKTALEAALKANGDADAAAKAELKQSISDLQSKLEAAIKANADQDAADKAELQKAMEALQKTLEAAIKANGDADAAAKAELEQTISDLKAELEAAIKANADQDAANKAELQKAVDAAEKNLRGVVIVAAVLIAALLACVAVLFVKVKKQ